MPEIRVATASDADEVGRVFGCAFAEDPVMRWVWGHHEVAAKVDHMFGYLARVHLVPLGTVYVTGGAAASWTAPHPTPWTEDETLTFGAAMLQWGTEEDLHRLAVLGEILDAAHPPQPYWYLGVLGTEPGRQGQGLGSALLDHTLRPVDDAGLPAYLESSSPRNVALYERHGFRVTGRLDLPDGPPLFPMWREPRGPSA